VETVTYWPRTIVSRSFFSMSCWYWPRSINRKLMNRKANRNEPKISSEWKG